ncbi:hypothetical protein VA596_12265 [Amycolatopsis sp., V23-08]|uniref:DUF3558 domain-containing protein n=1 Tax=Amycolatopsis heterodermiae TaxID=3110235 RepID=A0ABU5R283_9PSEU|nr:hypothetical protein [Amycolatopsis sp., V23-08]MEA5360312.1 hypothetical protein [Amycolatopsis sp., V23-08]
MRRLPAVSGVLLLLVIAAACGRNEPEAANEPALCSSGYQPRELADRPLQLALPSLPGHPPVEHQPAEARTTDAAAIKKIAAAACSLPTPPSDIACTLELGPSYELRFVDTQGRTTTVTAASFGCQFVEGLGSQRYKAKPLWEALASAGLPAAQPR